MRRQLRRRKGGVAYSLRPGPQRLTGHGRDPWNSTTRSAHARDLATPSARSASISLSRTPRHRAAGVRAHGRVALRQLRHGRLRGVRARGRLHRLGRFVVVETIYAGSAPSVRVGPGECARIFTGAPMPLADGADAVVAQEDARRGRCRRFASPNSRRADASSAIGRRRRRAGEARSSKSARAVHAGTSRCSLAAGVANARRPLAASIAVITSGDELRAAGCASSRLRDPRQLDFALPAVAATLPVEPRLRDATRTTPERARQAFDLARCRSGRDRHHGRRLRRRRGSRPRGARRAGQIEFWRLALKPGRPFAYGRYRGRAASSACRAIPSPRW